MWINLNNFVNFIMILWIFFWHENNYDSLASEQWVLLCDGGLSLLGLVGLFNSLESI